MIRFTLALTLILSISVLTGCSTPGVAISESMDSAYKAGTVKTDSIKHRFYIKSVGTADLKIDTVVASCDCMTANWEKKPIKPGEKGFIDVIVKPNYLHKGPAQKTFMVKTNANKKFSVFNIFYNI